MVKASFEHEGNSGLLTVVTHFNKTIEIACEKRDDEKFRLGGTAINEVIVYEGLLLRLPETLLFLEHFVQKKFTLRALVFCLQKNGT